MHSKDAIKIINHIKDSCNQLVMLKNPIQKNGLKRKMMVRKLLKKEVKLKTVLDLLKCNSLATFCDQTWKEEKNKIEKKMGRNFGAFE